MTILTAVLLGLCIRWRSPASPRSLFPGAANGSLVKVNGQVVGSSLIGQQFTSAKYFQPRPSAAGNGYDAMASSFSNLGPTNAKLIARIKGRHGEARHVRIPACKAGSIPVDMVTTSGSGLDPDITVANARAQAPRVAAARGMSLAAVLRLVAAHTTGRTFGFLGEPRVNVLELNLALDAARGG